MIVDGAQREIKIHYNGNLKKHIFGVSAYPNPESKGSNVKNSLLLLD
jgi:hypothetical protein